MTPRVTVDNRTHLRLLDPELTGKRGAVAGFVALANLYHLRFGETGVGMRFAARTATLCRAVIDVVYVRAKEQVLRQIARRVVACVQNHHVIWDRPIGDGVSDTMGGELCRTDTESPVSVLISPALKLQAFAVAFVLGPKSFNCGGGDRLQHCISCLTRDPSRAIASAANAVTRNTGRVSTIRAFLVPVEGIDRLPLVTRKAVFRAKFGVRHALDLLLGRGVRRAGSAPTLPGFTMPFYHIHQLKGAV